MDYLGEAIALGIDSIILSVCFKLYLRHRNAIKAIQNVSLYEINPDLEELVQLEGNKMPYVAVRGKVKAIGSPIKSLNSPDVTGVVQKLSVKEHVVTRSTAGFWADQERTIQEVYNCVPFVLYTRNTEVEVLDVLSSDILDLDTIADRFEPSNPSIMDHLWGFFTGVRQRGLQTTEDLLREEVVITGIGELTCSGSGEGSLKLQPPSDGTPYFVTALPLSSLIRRLDQQKRTYRMLTVLFAGIGLIIAGFATRRWWLDRIRKLKDEEIRRRLEETRKDRRRRVREKDLPESQLCVVCRLHPREIILLPCGHVCLCEDCSDGIISLCPVCRAPIEKKAPAYIS